MKKLLSNLLFLNILTLTHSTHAMLNSKFTSIASSKISTTARRTFSSSHHYHSTKEHAIDGVKGIIGGSVGTAAGFLGGGVGAIVLGTIIILPCHLADIDVTIKDIESFICPPCIVAGALIGSGAAGGAPGIAGYSLFMATAYAAGKYKSKKQQDFRVK